MTSRVWLMINVQNWTITTDYWRKPSENTVARFPFENDQADHYWNSVISLTWTKQTLWYRFAWNWSISNFTQTRFVCFWCKFISNYSPTSWQTLSLWLWELLYNFNHGQSEFRKTFSYQITSSSYWHSNKYNTDLWQWYCMAYWYTWTHVIAYINGIEVQRVQTSLYSWERWEIWRDIDYSISNLIAEKIAWSFDDYLKYYNKTKSKYGL